VSQSEGLQCWYIYVKGMGEIEFLGIQLSQTYDWESESGKMIWVVWNNVEGENHDCGDNLQK
jgi:hypothetical protein